MPRQAIVLFAHGSRDPLWSRPVEAVAARIRAVDAAVLVACAYLELMAPDLPLAVRTLVAEGATKIKVVPMFLGVGRHAREDLPRLLEVLIREYAHIDFVLQQAVGEDPRIVDLLARVALGQPLAPSTTRI